MLHFGSQELNFECREASTCECGQLRKEYPHDSEKYKFSRFVDEGDLFSKWRDMICAYSRLDISYESDILPALSGLAKEFQRAGAGPYYAGMWKNSMIRDLMWMYRPEHLKSRPKVWKAPSWSWASSRGGFHFDDSMDVLGQNLDKTWCTVVSVECEMEGPEPTGEVVSGTLVMSGYMLEATVLPTSPEEGAWRMDPHCTVHISMESGQEINAQKESQFWECEERFLVDYTPEEKGDGQFSAGDTLYCAKLMSIDNFHHYPGHFYDYALVLRLIDPTMQIYKRVGMLQRKICYFKHFDMLWAVKQQKRDEEEEERVRDVFWSAEKQALKGRELTIFTIV
jgi:hypothetical protein